MKPFHLELPSHIDKLSTIISSSEKVEKLKSVLIEIKQDDVFKDMTTGGGKNYAKPLEDRLKFSSEKIGEFADGLCQNN